MSRWKFGRFGVSLAAAAALTMAGTACSANDGGSDDSAGSGEITLVVGDQVKSTQTLLESAGELSDLPYKIRWATFEAGPPLLEAAAAGKVDVGSTGDVPALFAQSAGSPLKIIAILAGSTANDFLLVPAGSPIRSVGELKGKRIAFTKGSSSNGLVLALLDQAGLEPGDVTETYLTPNEGLAAFNAGQIDAWAVWNPYAVIAQQQSKARVLADGTGLTTQQGYYLASDAALGDKAKNAALSDFVGRVTRAQRWAVHNKDKWVPIFSRLTTLPEPVAAATFDTSAREIVPIDAERIAKQQKLIDLFSGAGVIPNKPDATEYFDDEFNPVVEENRS
ncbi:aliphatic sulfonates ABC transporter substrate-binding protein [Gordonia iterans]|uniref:Putative aliphatic sulfonates-binding protein n=1 Tax=Gordonia iterans TaxID=1004901 RepID=A0A2S0KCN9_9ACTN|nr:ABC transporter substrate-binding protein [Gordonia iterans]AVL99454.1 aliphatic sulfonates ABC transporter substrate-binding protein [Gordonia iterans]